MLDRIANPTGEYARARMIALQRYQRTSPDGRAWLRQQLEAEIPQLRRAVWRPPAGMTPAEWNHLADRLEQAEANLATLWEKRRR